eukprot:scaffold1803_cov92-Amphora_coffeaeformis.AAC.89
MVIAYDIVCMCTAYSRHRSTSEATTRLPAVMWHKACQICVKMTSSTGTAPVPRVTHHDGEARPKTPTAWWLLLLTMTKKGHNAIIQQPQKTEEQEIPTVSFALRTLFE